MEADSHVSVSKVVCPAAWKPDDIRRAMAGRIHPNLGKIFFMMSVLKKPENMKWEI
jgi:hypothetical protein